LFERNAPAYDPVFSLEYIGAQIALAGPLAGWLIIWAAFKRKPADLFEKGLKYATIGVYVFFLISTLKGRTEGNWTLPAFIGLIVLSHQFLIDRDRIKVWLARLAALTIILILAVRLFLITNYLKSFGKKDSQVHNNKEWANDIKSHAKGRNVFFVDSYQRASKYWFYTGTPAFSLNTVNYRRNNFNFWKLEDAFQRQPAYAIYQGKHQDYFMDSIGTAKGIFLGRDIPDYSSYSRIRFNINQKLQPHIEGKKGTSLTLRLTAKVDKETDNLLVPPLDTALIYVAVYKNVKEEPFVVPTDLTVGDLWEHNPKAKFILPDSAGNYVIRIGVGSCLKWPTMNSSVIRLKVTE